MFGVLFGIIDLIGSAIFQTNMENAKIDNKINAIKNGHDTYSDNRGSLYYINKNGNDIKCYKTKDFNTKHELLVSSKDKTILRDYTAEKELEEENSFYKKYNDAMNQSRLNGKAYFYVSGFSSLDKRFGYYELETERYYTLSKQLNNYYIHYWNVSKNERSLVGSNRLSKNKFIKYGGYAALSYSKWR